MKAHGGFRKGERASEGRGCSERGTLNADRKANRKGAALFNASLLMARAARASSMNLKGDATLSNEEYEGHSSR